MKLTKRLFVPLLVGLVSLSVAGCAWLRQNPDKVARISSGAKVAAYVATFEYTQQNPESRLAFEAASQSLLQIEQAEVVDVALVLAIVNQLPVKELKSERAQVIITAASIIVNDYLGTIPADQVDTIRPLVKALREGIDLGLGRVVLSETSEALLLSDSQARRCLRQQQLVVANRQRIVRL